MHPKAWCGLLGNGVHHSSQANIIKGKLVMEVPDIKYGHVAFLERPAVDGFSLGQIIGLIVGYRAQSPAPYI